MSTASEPRTEPRVEGDPPSRPHSRQLRRLRKFDPAQLLQLLALIPILATITLVHESSQLQWLDYWGNLVKFINADGSLNPPGLVFFHEGHVPVTSGFI